jgi:hypothetical protein
LMLSTWYRCMLFERLSKNALARSSAASLHLS